MLVYSQKAYERENTTLEKNLRYYTLTFDIERKLHYGKKRRPAAGDKPTCERLYIRGELEKDTEAVDYRRAFKGVFIIATNETDAKKLPAEQLLEVYKSQGTSVEKGVQFLKDPMFYAESLYLKSPKRIMALLMVMGLSLLVYALAERKLRSALIEHGATIKNQKGKSYDHPTIRWVFQIFENVLLFTFSGEHGTEHMVMNMDEDHHTVIKCLGPPFEKIYFLE